MSKGKFITFEGIEGSGKTLQLRLLEEEFKRQGVAYVATLEPGGTDFGREVRKVLLQTDGAPREPLSELLLYLADRYQHLKEVVEPALERGLFVLSDLYHDATLVYQGYARSVGFERINQLAKLLDIRTPDLTLVLDVDVRVGLERARARNATEQREDLGRFEAEDLEFHQKVREGYRLLAEQDPRRVALVDGEGLPEEVFERIRQTLSELL